MSYTYQNPRLTISEVIGQPSDTAVDEDEPSGGDRLKPYEVHTPVFEGPLPLLLHLIEKEKLDITQVALAKVTDQFLDYVEAMRQPDDGQVRTSADGGDETPTDLPDPPPRSGDLRRTGEGDLRRTGEGDLRRTGEGDLRRTGEGDLRRTGEGGWRQTADPAGPWELATIAEFLSVAAHLMLLKSRVLLPKPPDSSKQGNDPQEDEIEDELVRQLRAYRQYKESAQWLRERNHAGLRAYVSVTAPPKPQRIHLDLSDVTVETLREAAQRLLYPQEGPRPQEAIQRPRISVVQQINLIRDRLKHWKQVVFHALLNPQPTRLEAVVTLQAILELVKQRIVQAVQPHPFGEILIEATAPPDEIESG